MKLRGIYEKVIDYKYSQLVREWGFGSQVLGKVVTVPGGFVYDHESVPFFKGTSHRGGLVHDYLCRIDSRPIVSKKTAADVYLEVMTIQGNPRWKRYLKYWAVRAWPGYFHKHNVDATYEEIAGRKENG